MGKRFETKNYCFGLGLKGSFHYFPSWNTTPSNHGWYKVINSYWLWFHFYIGFKIRYDTGVIIEFLEFRKWVETQKEQHYASILEELDERLKIYNLEI